MSNKSRLQTNNENILALINKANDLPNGTVEDLTSALNQQAKTITQLEVALENFKYKTCDVMIEVEDRYTLYSVGYTTLINGKLTSQVINYPQNESTLSNVAVGSCLQLFFSDGNGTSDVIVTNGEEIHRALTGHDASLYVSVDGPDYVIINISYGNIGGFE